nr:unnamed protein product [Spirometra erinaceieuropaei]
MDLFGHMRVYENGIDRSPDTPSTSCTSTMPSLTHTPPPSAFTANSSITPSASSTPTMPSPPNACLPQPPPPRPAKHSIACRTPSGIVTVLTSAKNPRCTKQASCLSCYTEQSPGRCAKRREDSTTSASAVFGGY